MSEKYIIQAALHMGRALGHKNWGSPISVLLGPLMLALSTAFTAPISSLLRALLLAMLLLSMHTSCGVAVSDCLSSIAGSSLKAARTGIQFQKVSKTACNDQQNRQGHVRKSAGDCHVHTNVPDFNMHSLSKMHKVVLRFIACSQAETFVQFVHHCAYDALHCSPSGRHS